VAIYRLPSPNPSIIGPTPADLATKEIVFDGAESTKLRTGAAVTFGYLETRDAREAFRLLKNFEPGRPIGVIGVSLGGAAAILARPRLEVEAIVAESVYPTIDEAISDRMRIYFGSFGANELRPIDAVRELRIPKLFLFGSRDRHTRLEESLRLYEAAAEPKESWQIENAVQNMKIESWNF
jgi:fermentation-respiration switch protein FrsA (DUF1100 family)